VLNATTSKFEIQLLPFFFLSPQPRLTRSVVTLVITLLLWWMQGTSSSGCGSHLTLILHKELLSPCASSSVGSPRKTKVFGPIPRGKTLRFEAAREAESQRFTLKNTFYSLHLQGFLDSNASGSTYPNQMSAVRVTTRLRDLDLQES